GTAGAGEAERGAAGRREEGRWERCSHRDRGGGEEVPRGSVVEEKTRRRRYVTPRPCATSCCASRYRMRDSADAPRSRTRSYHGRRLNTSSVISSVCVRSSTNTASRRAATRSSYVINTDSSLNAIERLSKLFVPTAPHVPSATSVFACIIAGLYSKMRTPALSSREYW